MAVEVKFFASFREIVGKKKISTEARNVNELVDFIGREFEELGEEMFSDTESRELKDYVNIMVNGRRIDTLEGLKTELEDEDTVAIFPPVSGG